ncbi:MAG: hypothetical protein WAO35_12375 [Terriglobia bacterium]
MRCTLLLSILCVCSLAYSQDHSTETTTEDAWFLVIGDFNAYHGEKDCDYWAITDGCIRPLYEDVVIIPRTGRAYAAQETLHWYIRGAFPGEVPTPADPMNFHKDFKFKISYRPFPKGHEKAGGSDFTWERAEATIPGAQTPTDPEILELLTLSQAMPLPGGRLVIANIAWNESLHLGVLENMARQVQQCYELLSNNRPCPDPTVVKIERDFLRNSPAVSLVNDPWGEMDI